MNESQSKEIINVRLDEIIPNRFQPRLTFNENELKELSESIKLHGIIQPLVLRKVGDKYEIIAGERRYKASQMAGLQTVPAIIVEMDDKKSAEVALVENIQRKDLSAIEEAQSYKKILDMGYLTQEELASRMGVSQPTIANKLRLLNLAIPVKDALLNNRISERHARSLLNITDSNLQISMLNRIINERLTVRQTDEEINKLLGRNTTVIEPEELVNSSLADSKVSVDINNIKDNSEDIIKSPKVSDMDMLLRPESASETKTVQTQELAINPFQEVEPEIMSFEFEKPDSTLPSNDNTNSLIEEFRKSQEPEMPVVSDPVINEEKTLTTAINAARKEVNQIRDMGFDVDTEEFDFEDMYQIIIKIKKD